MHLEGLAQLQLPGATNQDAQRQTSHPGFPDALDRLNAMDTIGMRSRKRPGGQDV